MRILTAVLLAGIAACKDAPSAPNLGPAKVAIESAVLVGDNRVRVTLKNEGGPGSFYVEVAGFNTIPNGDNAPRAQTFPVDVLPGYRETVTYSATFDLSMIRVFSRAANSAVYSRTGCYYLWNDTHC